MGILLPALVNKLTIWLIKQPPWEYKIRHGDIIVAMCNNDDNILLKNDIILPMTALTTYNDSNKNEQEQKYFTHDGFYTYNNCNKMNKASDIMHKAIITTYNRLNKINKNKNILHMT